jgi:hypothetical protein
MCGGLFSGAADESAFLVLAIVVDNQHRTASLLRKQDERLAYVRPLVPTVVVVHSGEVHYWVHGDKRQW